jgi:anaerobic sulfite reductase subunit A
LKNSKDYRAFLKHRENLYKFLNRIYQLEVDSELLKKLKNLTFPVNCEDSELKEGYLLLNSYLEKCSDDSDTLTDLAADYARVFMGAGLPKNSGAYPYASFYTSPKRILMQEARDQAVSAFSSEGLCKDSKAGNFPEDHVALLLEFMSFLCGTSTEKYGKSNDQEWQSEFKKQHTFLKENLVNWIPDFCCDLASYSETSFYQGIAKITNSWIRMDFNTLDCLVNK